MKTRCAIAEDFGGLLDMRRHRQAHQVQIADDVRHAAIEEHRPGKRLRRTVAAHLPCQHLFGECGGIAPGQGIAADRGLILNDRAAGLDSGVEASRFQRADQAGLARTGAARDDDQVVVSWSDERNHLLTQG